MLCKQHEIGNVMAMNCPVCVLNRVILKVEDYDLLVNKLLAYSKGKITKREWNHCQRMWGRLTQKTGKEKP